MTLSQKFFKNVRHYRQQQNLSLRAAAERVGKSHAWWHQSAEGYASTVANLETVETAAKALRMKPLGLLREPPTYETDTDE